MPRKRPPSPPPRREYGSGSVSYSPSRRRWRARLPRAGRDVPRESWHRTEDEARAWIAREMARQPDSFDPGEPVGAYLNYWYRLLVAGWGAQTALRYRYEMAALKPLAPVPLDRLRGDQVQALKAALLARGLTRRYVYHVISLLRRALADAVKWKILAENVVETVTLPEPERKASQAWDLDEIRAVLAAIVGHRFEAVYLLILWGGLRIGEAVALRWDQIEDDGTVAFDQAEHTQIRGRPLGSTKRERDRETQLPAHVVARLKELRAAGPAPLAWPGRPRADVAYVYVAQRPDGSRWHPRTIRNDWVALVSGLKVRQLRPHGGRKSFGTMHMVSGTPLADLSALLGHSSPAVTATSYIASSKGRRREAAERLAALLEPAAGTAPGTIDGQIDGHPAM